jgi:hypothetical protein
MEPSIGPMHFTPGLGVAILFVIANETCDSSSHALHRPPPFTLPIKNCQMHQGARVSIFFAKFGRRRRREQYLWDGPTVFYRNMLTLQRMLLSKHSRKALWVLAERDSADNLQP